MIFFRRKKREAFKGEGVPAGVRAYVIGDIHGRFDLLTALYKKIAADIAANAPASSMEVFLGDYVDRGPNSRDVVEWLIRTPAVTDERICLKGNHEEILLECLKSHAAISGWRDLGGFETLYSYGVAPPVSGTPDDLRRAHHAFTTALPSDHVDFFRSLSTSAELGSYLFVHAGINPGRKLDAQRSQDLLWIREPFLSSTLDFGRVVVHGHTPVEKPQVRNNRINIDTGAYITGRLTCLVLEGDSRRFLRTGMSVRSGAAHVRSKL